MRLIGYIRVSQEDEHPENQKHAILEYCAKQGYRLIDIKEDIGVSGAISPFNRKGFKEVLDNLDNADGIIVYALDRIARSLTELYEVVKEFQKRGKVIISVRESWLNQIDPKIRELIIMILGWAAEMEREFIRERTREALRRLKAEGKRIGRPPKWTPEIRERVKKLIAKGLTLKEIASLVNIGYSTLKRKIREDKELLDAWISAKYKAKS